MLCTLKKWQETVKERQDSVESCVNDKFNENKNKSLKGKFKRQPQF